MENVMNLEEKEFIRFFEGQMENLRLHFENGYVGYAREGLSILIKILEEIHNDASRGISPKIVKKLILELTDYIVQNEKSLKLHHEINNLVDCKKDFKVSANF